MKELSFEEFKKLSVSAQQALADKNQRKNEMLSRETGRIYPKSRTIEQFEKLGENNYLQFNLHPAQREAFKKLVTKYERVGEDQYKVVEVKQYNMTEVDFSEVEKREMAKLIAFNPDINYKRIRDFGQMVKRCSKMKFKTQLLMRMSKWRGKIRAKMSIPSEVIGLKEAKALHWHRKDLKRKLYQARVSK